MPGTEIKVGDFITSLGKPGIVTDVLKSSDGSISYIKLLSPDLIARNSDTLGGELIDIGYHIKEATKEDVIKSIGLYIGMLESRIKKLNEFRESIK